MEKLKGKVLVAQSGGPTAVINNSIAGVMQEAAKHDEVEAVYGAVNGILGVLSEDLVDLSREEPETIELLRRTPSAALGSCRYKLKPQDYERVLKVFQAHNVRYFFYTGGNDSMDTANKVAQLAEESGYELRVMGIPKTVDNDLAFTDHCPGYGSVARWLSLAVRDASLDTEAMYTFDTVKVIETMGRNTGWITASTALARDHLDAGPHLIYLPERLFNAERFLCDVEEVYKRLGWVLVTVCEGLKDERGELIMASQRALERDGFEHPQLGGVCAYLCDLVMENLKLKARWDKPGTIQRVSGMCISSVDADEAYLVGQAAMRHALEGTSGYMVALVRESNAPYRCSTSLVRLEEVANATKSVPAEFINEAGNDVTEAFLEYARPLIGEPLPKYARLAMLPVKRKASEDR